MRVSEERKHLLLAIQAAADPRSADVIERNIPSALKVCGLRISDVRRIVRSWRREHQAVSPSSLLHLVESLWRGEFREERLVALELLQQYPEAASELDWDLLDRWRQDLDNWELTDVLGLYVVGPWVAQDLEGRERYLWDLVNEEDIWSRRLSLVSGIGLARVQKDPMFPSVSLRLVDRVKDQRQPLIIKAVSWALRYLGKRWPEEVATYLDKNRGALAPQVLREVTNKLHTGRKDSRSPD